MVVVKISVSVSPDNRREFLQMIESSIDDTRKESDCLRVNFCQNIERENSFWCLQEWRSAQTAKVHFHSDTFKALLGGMEVLGEIEDLKLISPSEINSMESLQIKAR